MASSRGMGRTASSVGMMEGAFFVSRTELIQWVNNLLQVNITKVEQCASAAIYCQILDACNPGSVAMKKVNWMAKAEHEFIPNYKVLQAAFDRNGIEKHVDVDKLIRAKYQDNLEFLQWMKCLWEREGAGRCDYNPVQAREGRPVPAWARPVGPPGAGAAPRPGEKENQRPAVADSVKKPASTPATRAVPGASRPGTAPKTPRSAEQEAQASATAAVVSHREQELRVKCNAQAEELSELRGTLDGLERERDYYFRKLRNVEILCETLLANMDPALTAGKLAEDIQGILYAENDEEPDADAVCA